MLLTNLLLELLQTKTSLGFKVFYTPMNEIFKSNPNWAGESISTADGVHPNDVGYHVMAQVWLNTIMTAMNSAAEPQVADDFEREQLGITWDADPEFEIQNGDLVNTAVTGASKWQYMATFKSLRNPTSVALRWSVNADAPGINDGGLALLLDAPTKDASGFLAWITTSDNVLRLWTITTGNADNDLNLEVNSQAPVPGPGDNFRVNLAPVGDDLEFEYFVNGEFAGKIVLPGQTLSGEWFSGAILRHDRQNALAEFSAESEEDLAPPAQVQDLTVIDATATAATLTWTASGDDGNNGRAVRYDLRYSTSPISNDTNFEAAIAAAGLPAPQSAGGPETFVLLELQPATTYYFAIKAFDDTGNPSQVSNLASITTEPGALFVDDFNRSALGVNWLAATAVQIVNNELVNTSGDQGLWGLAVLTSSPNPNEVSFKWSPAADSVGIDQVGIAVMLDAAALTANGYLITRRTVQNQIRIWKIINGQNPSEPIIQTPLLAKPKPGQELRIAMYSDAGGNHFRVYVNGRPDITISDPTFFINPATVPQTYGGVMFPGGRNNMVDDFKVVTGQSPTAVSEDTPGLPADYALSQNYPNPFNAQTRLNYALATASPVTIEVYNLMGQLIKTLFDGQQPAGRYSIAWDGSSDSGGLVAASGFYLIRMRAGSFVAVRKMAMIK